MGQQTDSKMQLLKTTKNNQISNCQPLPNNAPITVHDLKIWPQYFEAVRDGRKTFELRKWDRDYKEGDRLILREYDPIMEDFTGEKVRAVITYILTGPHAPASMCLMSIRVVA